MSHIYGRVPEWPKGTDCKSAAFSFGGSNPPSPTIPRVLIGFEMFYKHSRFFIAFNQYADNFYSPPSILIIFLLFLFAVFRMSCVTSIFRERLLKVGVKIVFTD